MGYSTREAVAITTESVPGVHDSGGDRVLISLTQANSFPGRIEPNKGTFRDIAASNRAVQTFYGTYKTDLKLQTPLWYSQAAVLIPLFCSPSGTPLELGTFTLDHFQMLEGGSTIKFERYLGCMGESLDLSADNQGTTFMANMSFPCMGYDDTITESDFPEPAIDDYPWPGSVAKFQHLAGHVTMGTSRTGFKSWKTGFKNTIARIYDESAYPQVLTWRGRDVTFSINLRHKSTSDRTDFMAVTAKTCSMSFTDGTTTVAFDYKSQNIYQAVKDEIPLNAEHRQTVDVMSMLDGSAGTDCTVTVTP